MRTRYRVAALIASLAVSTLPSVCFAAPALSQNARPLPAADLAPTLVDESDTLERGMLAGDTPGAIADESRAGEPSMAASAPTDPVKRSWLRQTRESQPAAEEPASSGGAAWSALAVVLLGGLAGVALVLKLRRSGTTPWSPPAAVRVLSTTRLGPKANLVTAEVHGRVLLLGVTDQSVSELGWLDHAGDAPPAASDTEEIGVEGAAPTPTRSAFGQVLGNVFHGTERRKEPEFRGNPNVAALIAARETRDVVSTNYTRASAGQERRSPTPRVTEPEPRVETQVAGLLRRRR